MKRHALIAVFIVASFFGATTAIADSATEAALAADPVAEKRLQKLSDADPTTCPACGKEAVSRQVTAPGFRLAGAGWYETDFKKDGDKKKNLAETASPPPSSSAASD